MKDLESARFVKFMDAPSWSKSLTKKDIKYCEKEYGPLVRDFAELAELVRKTDRILNEQFSSGQVPSRNDYVGLTYVSGLTVDLTKNTFRIVLRVHYSVLFLKPEIERILGVTAANSSEMISRVIAVKSSEMVSKETLTNSFYLDLCNCFQFVEEERCSSLSLTIADDNSKPKIAKWHYEGNSIEDGRRRIEGIIETIEKWQGLSLLRNSTMQNSNKAGETGGNATLGSKIKDFFWTLYEKTLKVIVDAAFERWWPK